MSDDDPIKNTVEKKYRRRTRAQSVLIKDRVQSVPSRNRSHSKGEDLKLNLDSINDKKKKSRINKKSNSDRHEYHNGTRRRKKTEEEEKGDQSYKRSNSENKTNTRKFVISSSTSISGGDKQHSSRCHSSKRKTKTSTPGRKVSSSQSRRSFNKNTTIVDFCYVCDKESVSLNNIDAITSHSQPFSDSPIYKPIVICDNCNYTYQGKNTDHRSSMWDKVVPLSPRGKKMVTVRG